MIARDLACRARNESPAQPPPGGLAGLDLHHDLHLALGDWTACSVVTEALKDAGAELVTLQISRLEGGFGARCRLRNLTDVAARALAARLLQGGVARHASVEHLFLTKHAAAAP